MRKISLEKKVKRLKRLMENKKTILIIMQSQRSKSTSMKNTKSFLKRKVTQMFNKFVFMNKINSRL